MMPFTENMPKAMAPLAGTTLIANGIDKLKKRIPNIHITVGYEGSMLASHVIEHDVNSVINTEGKDNSWWIYNSLMKNLDAPIYVLTCDNVIELDFDLLEKDYATSGNPACMVIPVKPIEGLDGDFIFHENQKITELSRTKPSEMYCSGIQILNPKKINELTQKADNFYNVWIQLIQLGQLYCSNIYPKQWYAVDTVNQLEAINKITRG